MSRAKLEDMEQKETSEVDWIIVREIVTSLTYFLFTNF